MRLLLFRGGFELPSYIFGPTSHVALCLLHHIIHGPYPNGSRDLQVMQRVSFSLTALDVRMVRGYFLGQWQVGRYIRYGLPNI